MYGVKGPNVHLLDVMFRAFDSSFFLGVFFDLKFLKNCW